MSTYAIRVGENAMLKRLFRSVSGARLHVRVCLVDANFCSTAKGAATALGDLFNTLTVNTLAGADVSLAVHIQCQASAGRCECKGHGGVYSRPTSNTLAKECQIGPPYTVQVDAIVKNRRSSRTRFLQELQPAKAVYRFRELRRQL